jgi:DNA-binding transcriptional LysR family regulator
MDRLGAMAQFIRVVETGSFSAAARILGQGQPAISKAVAQLEDRLGVRLLTRTTRALVLTDAGQIFYDHARTALDAAEEAEAAAKGAGAALSGRLRICAPVTFARLHIIPTLSAFMAAHPALELDLILDDRRIDLVEEGIDVAIRAGALSDSSMVATHIAKGAGKLSPPGLSGARKRQCAPQRISAPCPSSPMARRRAGSTGYLARMEKPNWCAWHQRYASVHWKAFGKRFLPGLALQLCPNGRRWMPPAINWPKCGWLIIRFPQSICGRFSRPGGNPVRGPAPLLRICKI